MAELSRSHEAEAASNQATADTAWTSSGELFTKYAVIYKHNDGTYSRSFGDFCIKVKSHLMHHMLLLQ